MNEQFFHEVVSGRRRGLPASLLRGGLWVAQWPYRLVVGVRNHRFDLNSDAAAHAGVPVISVGNLTVGGTGKTPMVKWIAHRLRDQGVRVALLSRGYRAEQGGLNDEAIELEQALPDVPHLQYPDRVASAKIAVEELDTQLLLLDDGFQHRRLARDLDIVLLDATQPFGHGHLLPRGLLREPIHSLRRARVVCLTRADLVDEPTRESIRAQVRRCAPEAVWCEATHAPTGLINPLGERRPLEELCGKRTAAFCGIGNPDAFKRTLELLDARLDCWRVYPDHHAYSRSDIESLSHDACCLEIAVCTMKDLAKVQLTHLRDTPLWGVDVQMNIIVGEDSLNEELFSVARKALGQNA